MGFRGLRGLASQESEPENHLICHDVYLTPTNPKPSQGKYGGRISGICPKTVQIQGAGPYCPAVSTAHSGWLLVVTRPA